MKTKHTPGPWHVVHNSWEYSSIGSVDDQLICRVEINNASTEKTQDAYEIIKEANAHLIAAAPELLEALEQLLPKLSQLQDESAFTWPEKIEKLIAKAKGL